MAEKAILSFPVVLSAVVKLIRITSGNFDLTSTTTSYFSHPAFGRNLYVFFAMTSQLPPINVAVFSRDHYRMLRKFYRTWPPGRFPCLFRDTIPSCRQAQSCDFSHNGCWATFATPFLRNTAGMKTVLPHRTPVIEGYRWTFLAKTYSLSVTLGGQPFLTQFRTLASSGSSAVAFAKLSSDKGRLSNVS